MIDERRLHRLLLPGGFGVTSLVIVHLTIRSTPEVTRVPTLVGIAFPVIVTSIVLGYTYNYLHHPNAQTLFKTTTVGALIMAFIFAITSISVIWAQRTQGVTIAHPALLVLNLGLGGGLHGLLFGHLYGRLRIYRHREQARKQRLQVLTRVLRHNIRNQINVAQGNIEMVLDDVPASATDRLRTALDALNRLSSSAELARTTQKTFSTATPSEYDLIKETEQAVADASEEYPETKITLSTSVPKLQVTAIDGVEEALFELIENACVHGEEPIEVRVYSSDGHGIFEVEDQGSGIPNQELAVIEQGKETQLQHTSGLGLWMTHWVVEGSSGDLSFETNGGTTVRVALPQAKVEPTQEPLQPKETMH